MFNLLYKYIRFSGSRYKCIVCGRFTRLFFPFSDNLQRMASENGFPYSFQEMETLNYHQCNCPFCLSSDRERLYMIFIEQYTSQFKNKQFRVLDFAPNNSFSKRMKENINFKYVSTDLFRNDVDIKMDIENMNGIENESYDIIICSHVLEHVPNPDKALLELKRILSKEGFAIIMVPLFLSVDKKIECNEHVSPKDRWRYYGQGDHLRLYSKTDFLLELSNNGFNVKERRIDGMDAKLIKENAISTNSILYICTKSSDILKSI